MKQELLEKLITANFYKIILILIILVIFIAAAIFLRSKFTDYNFLVKEEINLKTEFETKQAQAANLANYFKELEETKAKFNTIMTKILGRKTLKIINDGEKIKVTVNKNYNSNSLSKKKIIHHEQESQIAATIMNDFSKICIESGLSIILFQPFAKIKHDFYVEFPIKIKIRGKYQQLLIFFTHILTMQQPLQWSRFKLFKPDLHNKNLLQLEIFFKVYHLPVNEY